MAKDPAFPFYAQDFLTGVLHMDFDLRGRYITLLAYQWSNANKIPKKRLGFLIGFTWESMDEDLREKFNDCGDYIENTRLLEERQKRDAFKKRQSENGKKGGRGNKSKVIIKPNKSQKKPLEDEYEYEREYVNEIEVIENVEFPFFSEIFKTQWQHWKIYKSKEFGFKYKSIQSEQAALKQLSNLSKLNETIAIKILHQSMSNGWKGFFELKESENKKKGVMEILRERHQA